MVKSSTYTVVGAGVATHRLNLKARCNTSFCSVSFSINQSPAQTPYSEVLEEGTYQLVFPDEVYIGGKRFRFKQWLQE